MKTAILLGLIMSSTIAISGAIAMEGTTDAAMMKNDKMLNIPRTTTAKAYTAKAMNMSQMNPSEVAKHFGYSW